MLTDALQQLLNQQAMQQQQAALQAVLLVWTSDNFVLRISSAIVVCLCERVWVKKREGCEQVKS